ncbi:hypothetical protein N8513_00490 [bacterium]|nr:hypothetical protein [bacterium]MDA7519482.1 hypothetical protein [Akkermansiaceae bacterium]MDA7931663.1 hypothetical protein [Akkermansiaceae bacterium]MDB0055789.1 hypothetical protein [Akkermansiaceae bacterium]MDB4258457.1 hypothetical protein [Akkermansiaceae bacterium]
MKYFSLLIFALLFSPATGEEAKRTWTATDGRSFEGKFVSATETEVKISKKGRPVTVPLKMLSEGDRDFVKEKLAGAELASRSFETSPFGEFIKDEWVKVPKESYGLVFQVYGTKKMTRSKEPVPLFIHLHGAGARADDVQAGKVEIAPQEVAKEGLYKKNPCLIIVPLCPPDTGWGDQVSKLEAIIDEAIKTAPIDPKRIYISGYSMGARGCDSLIKSRPKFYAAALFADGDANRKWPEMTDTALWMIYSGERDMKKAEEVAKAYQEAGKVVHYEAFPKATHNQIHWKLAKDDKVFPWMFEQVRN